MKKLVQRIIHSVFSVIMTFCIMATPIMLIAYASPEPIVTNKSYERGQLLGVLSVEQWEKYGKIVKMISEESLLKQLFSFQSWPNSGIGGDDKAGMNGYPKARNSESLLLSAARESTGFINASTLSLNLR